MDKQDKKFAQDAFAQALMQSLDAEADAFQEFIDNRGMNIMMGAVVVAGLEEMSAIVETVQRMGLEDAMHRYEKALLSLAFHEGCQAGRLMEGKK